MELTKKQFETIKKTREAIKEVDNGSPLKDYLEQDEIIEGLELLVLITKTATAKSMVI